VRAVAYSMRWIAIAGHGAVTSESAAAYAWTSVAHQRSVAASSAVT